MYLRGLGAALDPETARETLQYLVSGTVKPDDMYWALKYFSAEGEHADIAWSFAVAHMKELQDRFGLLSQSWLLSAIAAGFTDNQRADDVLAFAETNLPPGGLQAVKNSIKGIQFRATLKAKKLPAIDDWIKAKLEGTRGSTSRNP